MSNKILVTTALIFFGLIAQCAVCAQEKYNYSVQTDNVNQSNLKGYAIFVPAGITCSAVLTNEINSQSAVVGSSVNAVLMEDFKYNNSTIASAGSVINGSVVDVKKARFAKRNARMQIRFTTIRTPYNNIIPISATVATSDFSGVLKGGAMKDSIKDYAKDTVIGAGSGAILGTAVGAISDKSIGKGAIYGAALGASAGIIKATTEKGESILIPANSQINLYFDQPITLGAQ